MTPGLHDVILTSVSIQLQDDCANWRSVCRHTVAQQCRIPLLERQLHSDAQGEVLKIYLRHHAVHVQAIQAMTMSMSNQPIVSMQALMPVAVFVVGCAFSTEKFSLGTLGNMIVVSIGVAIASYGALHFTPA